MLDIADFQNILNNDIKWAIVCFYREPVPIFYQLSKQSYSNAKIFFIVCLYICRYVLRFSKIKFRHFHLIIISFKLPKYEFKEIQRISSLKILTELLISQLQIFFFKVQLNLINYDFCLLAKSYKYLLKVQEKIVKNKIASKLLDALQKYGSI